MPLSGSRWTMRWWSFPRGCPYLILSDPPTGLTNAVARELELRLVQTFRRTVDRVLGSRNQQQDT
jgi:hypothetical protein